MATIMAQLEAEIGEVAQALTMLESAIADEDVEGAKQVYSMLLWHIAHNHNPLLVEGLDKLMENL